MTKQLVILEALKLSETERLEIVEAVYDSLDGMGDANLEQAWSHEIARRLSALDTGSANSSSWEDAKTQIADGADRGRHP